LEFLYVAELMNNGAVRAGDIRPRLAIGAGFEEIEEA
jgi:hypothetical protein